MEGWEGVRDGVGEKNQNTSYMYVCQHISYMYVCQHISYVCMSSFLKASLVDLEKTRFLCIYMHVCMSLHMHTRAQVTGRPEEGVEYLRAGAKTCYWWWTRVLWKSSNALSHWAISSVLQMTLWCKPLVPYLSFPVCSHFFLVPFWFSPPYWR